MLPTSVVSLFCDDIREERQGMVSLVGVYPDNVNVGSFPTALPKLMIYTRVNLDVASSVGDIHVDVHAPGTEEFNAIIQAEFIEKALKDAKEKGGQIGGVINKMSAVPFVITGPGQVKTTIKMGRKKYVGGIMNIRGPQEN